MAGSGYPGGSVSMQHLQQRVMMAPGSFAPGARKDGEDGDGLGEQVATLEGPPPLPPVQS